MLSDSDEFELSLSQEESLEIEIRKKKLEREEKLKQIRESRIKLFQEYYEENKNDEESIFRMLGVDFIQFCHWKIKFCYTPSKMYRHVSTKINFYCTLIFCNNHWQLAKDTFPAKIKSTIYDLFYEENTFAVNDKNVVDVIEKIYNILVGWGQTEEDFKRKRYTQYLQEDDLYLYSDEEELFLNDEERIEYRNKIDKILKRMIPPSQFIYHTRSKRRM